jgi:hemerythrin superfamily protein
MSVPRKSAIVHLLEDHEHLQHLFRSALDSTDTQFKTTRWREILKLLTQHEIIEKDLVHPIYLHLVGNKAEKHKVLDQEDAILAMLKEMENLQGEDASFNQQVDKLYKSFVRHVQEEEMVEFPAISDKIPQHLDFMGEVIEQLKGVAPSEPKKSGST